MEGWLRFTRLLALCSLPLLAAACAQDQPVSVVAEATEVSEPKAQPKPPYAEISPRAQGQRVPVIMYHDVIETRDQNAQWFDCTTLEFVDQMNWIAENGITPISLDQLYRHLTQGESIPEKSVVITFDDNYQGFYDRAYPILKQMGYPSAVFVHTGFVGNKEGIHPKMGWDTLRQLSKDPLVTIGSHTITHPDDITSIAEFEQTRELQESKAHLEKELGIKIPYLAYPNGMNNEAVQEKAKSAGYSMAFSIDNGLAEESPTIMSVNRYVHTRLSTAFEDWEKATRGGALGIYMGPLKDAPVSYEEGKFEGVRLSLITGGQPVSLMSDYREVVGDFIARTPDAVAGINGGFFAISEVAATDNRMVGPLKTADMPEVLPDIARDRWPRLRNRPILMWGDSGLAIVPYQPETMDTDDAFRQIMPDVSDVFMAGVWLVRNGQPRPAEDMNLYAASDVQDPRRRAFIGVKIDGTLVIGAARQSVSSERLARAIAEAGVWEAVLLDSGFSTSLVYGESVKASGHSTPDRPSRPVPHAIVVKGKLDPETEVFAVDEAKNAEPKRKNR